MQHHHLVKNTILFCFISLLFACASPTPLPKMKSSTEHQAQLAALQNWQIKGRLGFKGPGEKFSASLNWRQKSENYQLKLSSVLGTSLLEMHGEPGNVALEVDDQLYQDSDPGQLIWQITGWHIPVAHLPQWIKGQLVGNDKALTSPQGWAQQIQPQCLACQAWLIAYDNYQLLDTDGGDELWLPHKIVLKNSTTQSTIIIRVNTWINN
ncbi:MAG: outer membrane lipoprotein LolB [Paraglaciecola sp.]